MNPMEVIAGGKFSEVGSQQGVLTISVDRIIPDEGQPRKFHDESGLEELSATIKELGVIQPIIVRGADDDGRYRIIAGERRYRASLLAGLDEVPVRVLDADDADVALMQAVENLSREDLLPIEEALCVASLVDSLGSQSEVSASLGKSLQWVGSRLKVAKSSDRIIELGFHDKCRSINALAMLVPLLDDDKAVSLLSSLDEVKISDIRKIKSRLAEKPSVASVKFSVDEIRPVVKGISKKTGYSINVKANSRGANLTIGVTSKKELERIVSLLSSLSGGA